MTDPQRYGGIKRGLDAETCIAKMTYLSPSQQVSDATVASMTVQNSFVVYDEQFTLFNLDDCGDCGSGRWERSWYPSERNRRRRRRSRSCGRGGGRYFGRLVGSCGGIVSVATALSLLLATSFVVSVDATRTTATTSREVVHGRGRGRGGGRGEALGRVVGGTVRRGGGGGLMGAGWGGGSGVGDGGIRWNSMHKASTSSFSSSSSPASSIPSRSMGGDDVNGEIVSLSSSSCLSPVVHVDVFRWDDEDSDEKVRDVGLDRNRGDAVDGEAVVMKKIDVSIRGGSQEGEEDGGVDDGDDDSAVRTKKHGAVGDDPSDSDESESDLSSESDVELSEGGGDGVEVSAAGAAAAEIVSEVMMVENNGRHGIDDDDDLSKEKDNDNYDVENGVEVEVDVQMSPTKTTEEEDEPSSSSSSPAVVNMDVVLDSSGSLSAAEEAAVSSAGSEEKTGESKEGGELGDRDDDDDDNNDEEEDDELSPLDTLLLRAILPHVSFPPSVEEMVRIQEDAKKDDAFSRKRLDRRTLYRAALLEFSDVDYASLSPSLGTEETKEGSNDDVDDKSAGVEVGASVVATSGSIRRYFDERTVSRKLKAALGLATQPRWRRHLAPPTKSSVSSLGTENGRNGRRAAGGGGGGGAATTGIRLYGGTVAESGGMGIDMGEGDAGSVAAAKNPPSSMATLAMQETVMTSVAHSLQCGMITVDDAFLESVRRELALCARRVPSSSSNDCDGSGGGAANSTSLLSTYNRKKKKRAGDSETTTTSKSTTEPETLLVSSDEIRDLTNGDVLDALFRLADSGVLRKAAASGTSRGAGMSSSWLSRGRLSDLMKMDMDASAGGADDPNDELAMESLEMQLQFEREFSSSSSSSSSSSTALKAMKKRRGGRVVDDNSSSALPLVVFIRADIGGGGVLPSLTKSWACPTSQKLFHSKSAMRRLYGELTSPQSIHMICLGRESDLLSGDVAMMRSGGGGGGGGGAMEMDAAKRLMSGGGESSGPQQQQGDAGVNRSGMPSPLFGPAFGMQPNPQSPSPDGSSSSSSSSPSTSSSVPPAFPFPNQQQQGRSGNNNNNNNNYGGFGPNNNASGVNDPEGSQRFNIFLARTVDSNGNPGIMGAVAPPQAGNVFPLMFAMMQHRKMMEQQQQQQQQGQGQQQQPPPSGMMFPNNWPPGGQFTSPPPGMMMPPGPMFQQQHSQQQQQQQQPTLSPWNMMMSMNGNNNHQFIPHPHTNAAAAAAAAGNAQFFNATMEISGLSMNNNSEDGEGNNGGGENNKNNNNNVWGNNAPPPEILQKAMEMAMTQVVDRLAQDGTTAGGGSGGNNASPFMGSLGGGMTSGTGGQLPGPLAKAFQNVLSNEHLRRGIAENLARAAPALIDPRCQGVMLSVYVPPPPDHPNRGMMPGSVPPHVYQQQMQQRQQQMQMQQRKRQMEEEASAAASAAAAEGDVEDALLDDDNDNDNDIETLMESTSDEDELEEDDESEEEGEENALEEEDDDGDEEEDDLDEEDEAVLSSNKSSSSIEKSKGGGADAPGVGNSGSDNSSSHHHSNRSSWFHKILQSSSPTSSLGSTGTVVPADPSSSSTDSSSPANDGLGKSSNGRKRELRHKKRLGGAKQHQQHGTDEDVGDGEMTGKKKKKKNMNKKRKKDAGESSSPSPSSSSASSSSGEGTKKTNNKTSRKTSSKINKLRAAHARRMRHVQILENLCSSSPSSSSLGSNGGGGVIPLVAPNDPIRRKAWLGWIRREKNALLYSRNKLELLKSLVKRGLIIEKKIKSTTRRKTVMTDMDVEIGVKEKMGNDDHYVDGEKDEDGDGEEDRDTSTSSYRRAKSGFESLRPMLSVKDCTDRMDEVVRVGVEMEAMRSLRQKESPWKEALADADGGGRDKENKKEHEERLKTKLSSSSLTPIHPSSIESAMALVCGITPQSGIDGTSSMTDGTMPSSIRTREDLYNRASDKHERALCANVIFPENIGVNYDQIGGLSDVKELLRQSITYPLKYPSLYSEGIARESCKGVLLFGPPGTGKTMLAKAVATEGGATFLSVDASSVENKWLGESEKNAKAVFTLARRLAPCVVFIDEVDSMLSSREGSGDDSAHGTLTSVKTTMMSEWDGLNSGTNGENDAPRVVVIGSTNRPFDLDEAVLRRFPRRILVDLPDLDTRKEILDVTLAENRVDSNVNLTAIAERLEGYTGSDIKEVCREAVVRISHEQARRLDQGLWSSSSSSDGSKNVARDDDDEDEEYNNVSSLQRLRPVTMDDFELAMSKLKRSVSEKGRELARVWEWNDEYGEIKKKDRKDTLPQLMNMFL